VSPEGACNWVTIWVKDFCRFVFHIIPFSFVLVSVIFLSADSHLQIIMFVRSPDAPMWLSVAAVLRKGRLGVHYIRSVAFAL
jgi:hypothetical protein